MKKQIRKLTTIFMLGLFLAGCSVSNTEVNVNANVNIQAQLTAKDIYFIQNGLFPKILVECFDTPLDPTDPNNSFTASFDENDSSFILKNNGVILIEGSWRVIDNQTIEITINHKKVVLNVKIENDKIIFTLTDHELNRECSVKISN